MPFFLTPPPWRLCPPRPCPHGGQLLPWISLHLGHTHLIVEGAISPTLGGSHSALLPYSHGHIGVNVDSHQLLGLQNCDPHLKGAEEGEKEAKPAKVGRAEPEVVEGMWYFQGLGPGGRMVPGSPGLWIPGRDPCGPDPELGCRRGLRSALTLFVPPTTHTLAWCWG